MKAGNESFWFIVTFFVICVVGVSPTIIAFHRGHPRRILVCLLNIAFPSCLLIIFGCILEFCENVFPESFVRMFGLFLFFLVPVCWASGFFILAIGEKQARKP
jgi:hypothetical protein